MVPEFVKGQQFKLTLDAAAGGSGQERWRCYKLKPVLLGPVTCTCGWVKLKGEQFDRLSLLNFCDILPDFISKCWQN